MRYCDQENQALLRRGIEAVERYLRESGSKSLREFKLKAKLRTEDIFEDLKSAAMNLDYSVYYYIESVIQELHILKKEPE